MKTDTTPETTETPTEGSEASMETSAEGADVPTETPTEGSDVPTDMPAETPTDMPTDMPTDVPTETGHLPTEIDTKIPCEVQIMGVLETGAKQLKEIYEAVTTNSQSHVRKKVKELKDAGKIAKVKHGKYTLNADLMMRRADQNAWTVNLLLNLYDKEMAKILSAPDIDYAKLESVMNALYRCSMVVERSLKRWYLVHRGYDNNTQQAQEDAKQKTEKRKKADQENAPPEDRVVEVGHFHPDMQQLWEILPDPEKKKRTV